jgi:hypothetical protein
LSRHLLCYSCLTNKFALAVNAIMFNFYCLKYNIIVTHCFFSFLVLVVCRQQQQIKPCRLHVHSSRYWVHQTARFLQYCRSWHNYLWRPDANCLQVWCRSTPNSKGSWNMRLPTQSCRQLMRGRWLTSVDFYALFGVVFAFRADFVRVWKSHGADVPCPSIFIGWEMVSRYLIGWTDFLNAVPWPCRVSWFFTLIRNLLYKYIPYWP